VIVTYPDTSTEEVDVVVKVTPQSDDATPTAKETTVKHNAQPKAEDSIGNKDDLPAGTTYAWKPDATPNTSTPGTKQGKVIVTYPDTSTEEVDVVVKVTPQSDDATPTAKETTVKHNAQP
ncbi:Rib/alpha-like domain-containing protein, partial [Klebsiella pneumoniae]|uniref:Rib/alpha-like domain-containing protein n=1 Tax=Klebsiella pneumoniae TaxID=573 RepID=UPI0022288357